MKVKSAHETAGFGKHHAYLGHFKRPKFINQGHNTDPLNEEVVPRVTVTAKRMTQSEADAYDRTQGKFGGGLEYEKKMAETARQQDVEKEAERAAQNVRDLRNKRASEGRIKY